MSISLLLLCSNLLRPFEYWLWCWVYDFLVFRFPFSVFRLSGCRRSNLSWKKTGCHCEEQSDVAISLGYPIRWISND